MATDANRMRVFTNFIDGRTSASAGLWGCS
jgi:hypothetical protein